MTSQATPIPAQPLDRAFVTHWFQLTLWFPTSHPWHGLVAVVASVGMSRS